MGDEPDGRNIFLKLRNNILNKFAILKGPSLISSILSVNSIPRWRVSFCGYPSLIHDVKECEKNMHGNASEVPSVLFCTAILRFTTMPLNDGYFQKLSHIAECDSVIR